MPIIEFTRRGYYEVWDESGNTVSRHTNEREAIEKVTNLILERPNGTPSRYDIRGPLIVAKGYGVLSPSSGGGDTTGPSAPENVSAVATSATTVTVSWDASTDNVAVAGYQVFRGGIPIGTVSASPYSDTGLSPSTQYTYTVAAYDGTGNNSSLSSPAVVTTASNEAPVWSGLSSQTISNGSAVNLLLDSYCTDADNNTLTYSLASGALPTGLALSGARNQQLGGTPTVDGAYSFTLRASDGITSSDLSLTFTISTPDTTAPDQPSPPTLISKTSTSVTLGMPTSSASDHSSYSINRSTDGNNYGAVASGITESTWVQSGLNSATTYWYRVRDVDTSGNASVSSSPLEVTTDSFVVQQKNWNPGYYLRPGPWRSDAEYYSWIDVAVSDGYWKGVVILFEWSRIETSFGVYDWTKLDNVINYAASKGKKVGFNIAWNTFTGSRKPSPAYINAGGIYGPDYARTGSLASPTGWGTSSWNANTWERLEIFLTTMYNRYKDSTTLEFIKFPAESAFGGLVTSASGYNSAAINSNVLHMVNTVFTLPGKPFWAFGLNFWIGTALASWANTLYQALEATGTSGAGSTDAAHTEEYPTGTDFTTDAYFSLPTSANYIGIQQIVGVGGRNYDYRGKMPIVSFHEGAYTNTSINPSASYDDLIPAGQRYCSHIGWATSNPANPIDPADTFANLRVRLADPSTALIYTAYPSSFG